MKSEAYLITRIIVTFENTHIGIKLLLLRIDLLCNEHICVPHFLGQSGTRSTSNILIKDIVLGSNARLIIDDLMNGRVTATRVFSIPEPDISKECLLSYVFIKERPRQFEDVRVFPSVSD
jgi:hypothetical protein